MGGRGSSSRTSAGAVANAAAPNAGQAQNTALSSTIDSAFSNVANPTDYTSRYGKEIGNYMNGFSAIGFEVEIKSGYPQLSKTLNLGGREYQLLVSFDNRGPALAGVYRNGQRVGDGIRAYRNQRESLQASGKRVRTELKDAVRQVAGLGG